MTATTTTTITMKSAMVQFAFKIFDDLEIINIIDKTVPQNYLTQLYSLFGDTFYNACELIEKCQIIYYQIKNGFRGIYKIRINDESFTLFNHINYCHCLNFRIQVLENSTCLTCKHVLALRLIQIIHKDKIKIEIVSDSQLIDFLNDQLLYVVV